jgi:Sulfotransferase domain
VTDVAKESREEYIRSFPEHVGRVASPAPKGKVRSRAARIVRDRLPRPLYEAGLGYGYYGLRTAARRNPGRGRMLPDFLVIGAAKGGTTSLFRWLSEHPFIEPPSPPWLRGVPMKEVHFFDYNHYRRPDWYRAHFPLTRDLASFEREHGRAFLTGEASASYLSHRWAPERAKKLLPDAKLIVVLRDPVARAYSQFHMSRREGQEPFDSFEDAVAAEEERLRPELARVEADRRYNSWPLGIWSYLLRSRYAEHLERWLDVFPREQFLFVKAEDLFGAPQAALDGVADYLGVPRHAAAELPRLKDGGRYRPLAPETRARLDDYFRPHNERLVTLTGIDFGWDR